MFFCVHHVEHGGWVLKTCRQSLGMHKLRLVLRTLAINPEQDHHYEPIAQARSNPIKPSFPALKKD